jgi:hypothetical protein
LRKKPGEFFDPVIKERYLRRTLFPSAMKKLISLMGAYLILAVLAQTGIVA